MRNIGQLINSALEPNIYLTRCYCYCYCYWEVFTVFDNYLIQVLCEPLILIRKAIILEIYQLSISSLPLSMANTCYFLLQSLQPPWANFHKWSGESHKSSVVLHSRDDLHIWNLANDQVPCSYFQLSSPLTASYQWGSFLQSTLNITSK